MQHPRGRNLMWAGTAFLAYACSGPEDVDTGDNVRDVNIRYGVDYSWARPSPTTLHAQGYSFAVRYLSYDTTGKNLSRAEATALINAGLDVVSNWEQSAMDALSGYSRGASDARSADQQALANGAPAS